MKHLLNRFKSDEALMGAFGRGDSLAFEQLYLRHKDPLFGFIYRSLNDRHRVEDLAHETWLGVINSAARYQPEAAFKTWLFSIAHRKLVDHWRQQGRWQDVASALAARGELATVREAPERLENQRLSEELLAQLPPAQRQALLLQQQGFSLTEIAEISAAKVETIKSRLRYAMAKLRGLAGGAHE
ncbi:MAG: sigma-70 family RNA polymerase sigma factor [Cellvibrionaceae bacterium]|nr:sigma-70 family RNA polymerase sigma factor [Cellvibrionaceae bacterium]